MKIEKNVTLKDKSSMKVGGIAKTFIFIENINDLEQLIKEYNNFYILGNGTNTLFSDGVIDIPIVSLSHLENIHKLSPTKIKVQSGCKFSKLIQFLKTSDIGGLENLAGIPGTVGGLVFMNGGAYGSEIFDFITKVKIFDKYGFKEFNKNEIKYSYRNTEFQEKQQIIVDVEFQLKKGFDINKVNEIQKKRLEKQPLDKPNLGSIFKNPKDNFAAKLISEAGLQGMSIGGAKISEKHSNFIINEENASFDDIIAIIELVKNEIYNKFKINLKEEIIIVK